MQVGSKSFIIPNDKDIYCVKCFEDKIATKCTKCKNILTSGGVTFRYTALVLWWIRKGLFKIWIRI
jgi:hypothetical protein